MRAKQFNLRMSEAEFEVLSAKAEALGLSKNQLIIDAIAAYQGSNTTTIPSTIANITEYRLNQLEQQMGQVMEALKLDPKPELSMVDTTVDNMVGAKISPPSAPVQPKPAPAKPKPGTKITTEELANIYCDNPSDIWDNLEEFKQCGVEDDYGNTWHYRNAVDRWLLFTPQPQAKAKAKAKTQAKPKPSLVEAEDDYINDRVIAAKKQFTEWTGLEATEFNGQRIIKGYYLGETMKLSNPEAWIVLVDRLSNYIPRVHTFPMPASADELDIQTIGVGNFGKIIQGLEIKD